MVWKIPSRLSHQDGVVRGVVAAAQHGWSAALELVVPAACAGCGLPGITLCCACEALWSGPGVRVEQQAGRLDRLDTAPVLPVWALTSYTGPAASTLVAWKDRGRRDVDPLLQGAIAAEARRLRGLLDAVCRDLALVVVPVPSTARAVRERGTDLVKALAYGVATGLERPRACLLRTRRGKRDQVGLGARARGRNIAGSVVVHPRTLRRLGPLRDPLVALLVDDIVTTGATLSTCQDVLESVGVTPLAALCLAAAPPPGRARCA